MAWCWEWLPNFAYRAKGLHVYETKPRAHKLRKQQRLVLRQFLRLEIFDLPAVGLVFE